MRRRFIENKNYCKAKFTVYGTIECNIYGNEFDLSQIVQIKIDGNKHDINKNMVVLSSGEHIVEYWFNNFFNGDYFISSGIAFHVDIMEFNVDTSNTTSMINMFAGINSIVNLDHLDISNVISMRNMFSESNISESPFSKLHDTLHNECYSRMFYQCNHLKNAPILPAKTLKRYCYEQMFYGCRELNYIKALFTTTPSSNYTYNWVDGVSPTGTFIKNPEATWDVVGVDGVPEGWTVKFDGEEDSGIELPIRLYFDRVNDNAEAIISYIKSLDSDGDEYIGGMDEIDTKSIMHFNDTMYPQYIWIEEDCIGGGSCTFIDTGSLNFDILQWRFYSDGTFKIDWD